MSDCRAARVSRENAPRPIAQKEASVAQTLNPPPFDCHDLEIPQVKWVIQMATEEHVKFQGSWVAGQCWLALLPQGSYVPVLQTLACQSRRID